MYVGLQPCDNFYFAAPPVALDDMDINGKTRCCGLLLAMLVAIVLPAFGEGDSLPAHLRQWLTANEPIVFVSQTTYPPFEFVDDLGNRRGMAIDLARWIAQEFRFEAEFIDTTFQEAQQAVREGEADVLTSFFFSDERARLYDFTEMTWEVPAVIFVRADRPDIVDLQDLRGRRIAMQRGDYAAEFLRRNAIDHLNVPTSSFAEAADRVMAGGADAMIGDEPIVLYHLFNQGRQYEMKTVGAPIYVGINGMATRQGRPELIEILNRGIQQAHDTGAFAAITDAWLGSPVERPALMDSPVATPLFAGLIVIIAIAIVLLAWAFHLRRALIKRDIELLEARDPRKPIARPVRRRSLALRLAVLVALLVPLGFLANNLMIQRVILPGYLELELQAATQSMNLAASQLRMHAQHLGQTAEFAAALVAAGDDGAPPAAPTMAGQADMDLVALFDTKGVLLWSFIRGDTEGQPIFFHTPVERILGRLMHTDTPAGVRVGIQPTQHGAMALAAVPIPDTGERANAGLLLVGQFIQDKRLLQVGNWMGSSVTLLDPLRQELTSTISEVYARLQPGLLDIQLKNDEQLTVYQVLPDLEGHPGVMVQLDMPREFFRQGLQTGRLFSYVLVEFIVVAFITLALWFFLSFRETMRRQRHIEALVDARTGALKESEAKWRGYVTSAPMGIFTFDSQGRIREANPAACRMTGYSEEMLRRERLDRLLAPESRDMGWTYVGKIIEMGWAVEEMVAIDHQGSQRHWMISGVKLEEDRFLAFAEDITDRLEAERQREQLEIKLVQVQKMEAIGRLAGGVAHDFNNMLAVILGNTEIALESIPPDDSVRDELEEIEKAATRSTELTRQLLAFARQQAANPRVIDLNATLEGMLKMVQRLIGEDVTLHWDPRQDIGRIKVDPSQMDQLIVNLCVNARDAMDGKGSVTIETNELILDASADAHLEGAAPGDYVTLTVRDTGCGMDEKTQLHLFEPFFTTKKEGKGTGLGLATVYGIVKQNHGYIAVASKPGEGAAFTIYFPVFQDEQATTVDVIVENPEREITGETILVVEDEPAILNITKGILIRKGYRVLPALGVEEALLVSEQHPGQIDLLLADVVMPGMNGLELAGKLAELQPQMKQLFMSGHTSETIRRHGVSVSSNFIHKPFAGADLESKIRQILSG